MENYKWLFSDTVFDNGTVDIHFLLDVKNGTVKKVIQRRTKGDKVYEKNL